MRNRVGCKKLGVVGNTSSDIDLVCTTTGYSRPISLPVYTTAGYASSDMGLVYTATGYVNNDINLGCTIIGNTEFTALGTGYLGMPVAQYLTQLMGTQKNKTMI